MPDTNFKTFIREIEKLLAIGLNWTWRLILVRVLYVILLGVFHRVRLLCKNRRLRKQAARRKFLAKYTDIVQKQYDCLKDYNRFRVGVLGVCHSPSSKSRSIQDTERFQVLMENYWIATRNRMRFEEKHNIDYRDLEGILQLRE